MATKVTSRVLDDNSVGVAQLSAGAVTLDKLITSVQQALLPVGAVQAFARTSAPAGWLLCNGDIIGTTGTVQGIAASNLTTLRSTLATSFGSNGQLPNLQGVFVRGAGAQTIENPAGAGGGINTYTATYGQTQGDQFRRHTHAINSSNSGRSASEDADPVRSSGVGGINTRGGALQGPLLVLDDNDIAPDLTIKYTGGPSSNVTNNTPGETRPANVTLLYCIKY
jgi:microcystin-dependent protein